MINKRGVFFTILVIVILSLFFLTYTFYSNVQERKTINQRIDTLNNFVFSNQQDTARKIKISGFRIIFLLEKDMVESGEYIPNINTAFQEAFFNGTINGRNTPEITSIMAGATYKDIKKDLSEKAYKINTNISIYNPSISILQEDPWNIKVSLNSTITINDLSNLALWNNTYLITAFVPIENFEDPLYIINTNGLVTNKINKTIYGDFQNTSNLLPHTINSYYINSTDAPSFLDRIQGLNAPNPNGVESLVNLQKLSAQGIQVKDKSVVDHIYFSSVNPPASQVSGMPSWFKLDAQHSAIYHPS